ncbi:calcium-dependent phosphotriesterase [Schizophyllum commune H4-8]|uniref:SMP-30/Gluconolactonase/LRE-like region domain-containing protein n=1 Tax=Schizophyllum commune (strain H4-8 / FGSC 9210) TaxID=578458 RepID=D8QBK3_SCHCM|nr:calcium-dependent phosphotriesterase [Schizophyllum commune H4-8]KAI5889211.1 calcium-dependent phosphotriesterase [Schizophyllum commune H4-8]
MSSKSPPPTKSLSQSPTSPSAARSTSLLTIRSTSLFTLRNASLAFFAALLFGFWKRNIEPALELGGIWRIVEPHGTEGCRLVSELQACEKIVVHEPTGLVYAACSTIADRKAWLPALNYYNASARSGNDYIALYDPVADSFAKLDVIGLDDPRGLSLHGMDVVPSSEDPDMLWVYLVNHRPPVGDAESSTLAHSEDPSIEIFTTRAGSSELRHVRTVADPVVLHSPNDVAGSPDGMEFWFTNDMKDVDGWKVGGAKLYMIMQVAATSVGHCHVDRGCKIALDKLPGANGIVRLPATHQTGRLSKTDTKLMLGSATRPEVRILERQADDTLELTKFLPSDLPLDNLTVDKRGTVWAAGFPKGADLISKHIPDPLDNPSASTAVRISCASGKCTVDKPFESDGSNNIGSGSTTVAYDAERKRLFLSGTHHHCCSHSRLLPARS